MLEKFQKIQIKTKLEKTPKKAVAKKEKPKEEEIKEYSPFKYQFNFD